MICPVCNSNGASSMRDFTGRYIYCPNCERKVLLSEWVCPACSSSTGIVRVRNGGIEIECPQCHTRDNYKQVVL